MSERLVRALTHEDLHTLLTPGSGVLPYHDPRVTALVWEVKYRKNRHGVALAGQFLSEQLLGIVAEEFGTLLLVPVPMHQNRRKKRGYNQCEVLCEALIARSDSILDYAPRALLRIKETLPQQGLERGRRLKNVRGSMVAVRELIENRICVVVDDVITTGATLKEAHRALMQAGAARVHFLTLAQS
jgi:ComF family protein